MSFRGAYDEKSNERKARVLGLRRSGKDFYSATDMHGYPPTFRLPIRQAE